MKVKKFGTIKMTDKGLELTNFCFMACPDLIDRDDKEELDKRALFSVIMFLTEALVSREITDLETRH